MSNEVKRRFEEWCRELRIPEDNIAPGLLQSFLDSFDNMKLVPEKDWVEPKYIYEEVGPVNVTDLELGKLRLKPFESGIGGKLVDLGSRVEQLEKQFRETNQSITCALSQLSVRLVTLEADVKALNNIVNELSETEEIKKRI